MGMVGRHQLISGRQRRWSTRLPLPLFLFCSGDDAGLCSACFGGARSFAMAGQGIGGRTAIDSHSSGTIISAVRLRGDVIRHASSQQEMPVREIKQDSALRGGLCAGQVLGGLHPQVASWEARATSAVCLLLAFQMREAEA